MIKKEKKKTYYETEVVTDVLCDNCGGSLIGEDDDIYKVTIGQYYFIEHRGTLGSSEFYDYAAHLCEKMC